ncbi:MAG: hypothetical protein ACE5KE_15505 [Methanosarcinales archaeon]
MKAYEFKTKIQPTGTLIIPDHIKKDLKSDREARIIILIDEIEKPDDFEDLLIASETTFDFWDNSRDDEVWNKV